MSEQPQAEGVPPSSLIARLVNVFSAGCSGKIRWVWLGVVVLLVVLGMRRGPTFDFQIYMDAAASLVDCSKLYEGRDRSELYLYSPAFAAACYPLSLLPLWLGYAVWVFLGLAGLLVALCCFRVAFQSERSLATSSTAALWAMLVVALPITSNFRHGNSNTLVLLALGLGILAHCRGRPFLSGFVTAFAAALKVTPLIYGLWFLLRRDRRGSAGFVLGTLAWLAVFPALTLGPRAAFATTRSWVEVVLAPSVLRSGEADILQRSGQSIPRVVESIFASPWATKLLPQMTDSGWVSLFGLACSAVILVLSFAVAMRRPDRKATSFALLAAALLLAQPVSRQASFVLLVPLALLSMMSVPEGRRLAARAVLCAASIAVALLLLSKFLGHSSKALFPTAALTFVLWASWVGRLLSVRRRRP